ncbi:MAG TPA: DsbA family protein [Vicinamibacterales bacterium]|nr:DsbA family protein [Vicinamibacterales bacterium]
MRSRSIALGAALLLAGVALGVVLSGQQSTPGSSEIAALRKEIEDLKARQQTLEQQLAQILAAINQAREPQELPINIADAPSKGRPDARVTMIEFSDFQCPFCGRHVRETMPRIDREYIQTGKVRYVFRDFPIESLHPQAPKAHEAANCAKDQGKYWEMWERFFANPRQLAPSDLPGHAEALGLDMPRFRECLDSGRHAAAVRASVQDAIGLGASGTPIVFFGLTESGSNTVKAVRVVRGAYPYERFKSIIDGLLAQSQ